METKNKISAVKKFTNGKIAVIGDMMLDVYFRGDVTRISPEAPVPVVNVSKRTSCLGGAANVMRNITSLGGRAWAFGVTGSDESGREVVSELDKAGIDHAGVIAVSGRRTTEKCRIIAGAQQLLRADFENTCPVDDASREKIVGQLEELIASGNINAVIIDDYAKGLLDSWMLERLISAAQRSNIITLFDPKPVNGSIRPVKGLTVLKPNRSEAFMLAGINDDRFSGAPAENRNLLLAAEKIFAAWSPEYLLISLAAQGMALFHDGRLLKHIPTRAREVFDVSGAGDTVAATLTLALASGCDIASAAEIANSAAGIVVGKIGTTPVSQTELLAVFEEKQFL